MLENLQKHPGQVGLTRRKEKSFDTGKDKFFDISCCKKDTFEPFVRLFSQFNF